MSREHIEALANNIFGTIVCHCHILPDAEQKGEAICSLAIDLPRLNLVKVNRFAESMGLDATKVNVLFNGQLTISWMEGS